MPACPLQIWIQYKTSFCAASQKIIICDQSGGGSPEEKRFDASRWGSGSDGHLYDFAKRFSSLWFQHCGGGRDCGEGLVVVAVDMHRNNRNTFDSESQQVRGATFMIGREGRSQAGRRATN